MGSEISSFVVEPVLGIIAIALLIFGIIEENKGKNEGARWSTIGAIVVTVILIVLNIILSLSG